MSFKAIAVREMLGQRNGSDKFRIHLRLGEPYRVNDVAWACPLAVDGVDNKLADMHGIDSWQALLLAVSLARSRLERFIQTGGKLYWPDDPTREMALSEVF